MLTFLLTQSLAFLSRNIEADNSRTRYRRNEKSSFRDLQRFKRKWSCFPHCRWARKMTFFCFSTFYRFVSVEIWWLSVKLYSDPDAVKMTVQWVGECASFGSGTENFSLTYRDMAGWTCAIILHNASIHNY